MKNKTLSQKQHREALMSCVIDPRNTPAYKTVADMSDYSTPAGRTYLPMRAKEMLSEANPDIRKIVAMLGLHLAKLAEQVDTKFVKGEDVCWLDGSTTYHGKVSRFGKVNSIIATPDSMKKIGTHLLRKV